MKAKEEEKEAKYEEWESRTNRDENNGMTEREQKRR